MSTYMSVCNAHECLHVSMSLRQIKEREQSTRWPTIECMMSMLGYQGSGCCMATDFKVLGIVPDVISTKSHERYSRCAISLWSPPLLRKGVVAALGHSPRSLFTTNPVTPPISEILHIRTTHSTSASTSCHGIGHFNLWPLGLIAILSSIHQSPFDCTP